jgi:hypothetical protein
MELTKYAQAIKGQLSEQLKKQGSSIQEFEQALQNINTGEGVFKVASAVAPEFGLTSIPELAFKSSLAGGALAGLTADEMDKSVDSVNKALEREREKVNLVRRLTSNLKKEHGLF